VDVDEDQRIGGKIFAKRPNDIIRKVQLRRADEALRRSKRIELQGLEAFGNDLPRRIEDALRRALRPIPAISVAEHSFADSAAQELMDRNAERLAENIPASDLDGGDDRPVDVAAVERHAVQHALGESADAKRVLSDDQVFELAHAGLCGADEAV